MSLSAIDPTLTIEALTTQCEGQYFDRKSHLLAPKELVHHISAFANASGGLIVIGIENDGRITGVSYEEENRFHKAVTDTLPILPPNLTFEPITYTDASGKEYRLLLVHIYPSISDIIALSSGEAFLRSGDSSTRLNAKRLMALEYSKGIKSYETRIVEEASLNDLDDELIQQYANSFNTSVSSPLDILKSRGLIRVDGETVQITVAGILLFGKNPTQFLPGARVRFLRYDGSAMSVGTSFNNIKDVTFDQPLPKLLVECVKFLKTQLREFCRLNDNGIFEKTPEYPEFTIEEGLVNAVTHRDYSVNGEHIRISMYDDRIEFLSPGKLPNIVTVKNIKETRFSRNPIIARVLTEFGWVRELNEGVKRMYAEMEASFLDPPQFKEPNGLSVSLFLKNNITVRMMRLTERQQRLIGEKWDVLNKVEQAILVQIANSNKSTPRDLQNAIEKSRPVIRKSIKTLKDLNLIEECGTSPKDPQKYYLLSSSFKTT